MKPLATFWYEATEGVTYYRCKMPAKKLPGNLASFEKSDRQNRFWKKYVDGEVQVHLTDQKAPCGIWSFPGWSSRALLMKEQQNNGVRVLVEIDDNYTVPPPGMSSWSDEPEVGKASYKIHRSVLPWADGIICSTPTLADVYKDYNEHVYVCPNSVDPDDWTFPDKGLLLHQPLRIGWAASDSHWTDVDLIVPAFKWASRQPGVEIVVMGIHQSRFQHFGFPFTHVGWTNTLAQYRENLTYLDIAVCPLIRGEWEDSKSDVKALEASMAGALPVVSRVPPFEPWHDRVPTAENKMEFLKIIQDLVRNREGLREKAKQAKDYVLSERLIERSVDRWRDAVVG